MRLFHSWSNLLYLLSFILMFSSFGGLAAKDDALSVIQLREASYEQAPAIRVRFSEPLLAERIQDKIKLVMLKDGKALLGQAPHSWILGDDHASVTFPFVEANAEYQVLIDARLESKTGKTLGFSYSEGIKTKHISPQAVFSSTGYLMPLSGPKTLPITVTNVDQVNLDFYHINANQYKVFLKSRLNAGSEYNYQLNRFLQQTKLIYASRFSVEPKKNQRTFVNLDVSHVTELQRPGLYIAVMSKAGQYENRQSVIYFTVSDLAVHVRQYEHKIIAQVMDVILGEPAADVEVAIYDKDGVELANNNSDDQGVTELATVDNVKGSYLIARKNQHITILPLKKASLDLSDFNNALSPHSDIQAFSFGPRDLFRPGEVAQVQILLRDFDGQQLSKVPLSLTLTRPDGQVATNLVLQPEAAGYYQFNYQLSSSSPTGQWKVGYQALGQELKQDHYFKVEEFRPNRLKLEQLTAQENLLQAGKGKFLLRNSAQLKNTLKGAYLFGAKASGNKVDGVMTARFDRHPLPDYKHYAFGDQRENLYFRTRRLPAMTLNQQGEGEISIHNSWSKFASPLSVTYTMSLYDGGGQPVTSKQKVTLIQDNGLLGIKPEFSGEPDKNSRVGFSLVSLDKTLQAVASDYLKVSLVKEDRNYYWAYDDNRGWQFKYDASPYEVWQGDVYTDENGLGTLQAPLEFGHYQLVVTSPQTGATSTYHFKTAGRWWDNSRESKNKPETLLMSFDKSRYAPGETAELSYFSPHEGLAWFTVENNQGTLLQKSFAVKQGEGQMTLAVDETWSRHDNYASLMVVKQNGKQSVAKARAFGLVHLPVQRPNMKLELDVVAPESSLPLKKVTSRIRVANPKQLAGPTYAVVSLVDVGILNITKYPRPRPEDYFLAPRRYQVELFDVYDKLIEQNFGQTLSQAFGGDLVESDGELSRGGKRPAADVELLSFLSQPVLLDENGEAEVSFDLPEFAGKLRWSVVVFNQNQFGSEEQYTQVSAPFVSQLSSPYFLAPGDTTRAVLELHNTTTQEQPLHLAVNTSGGLMASEFEANYSLAAGTKQSVEIATQSDGSLKDGFLTYQIKNIGEESSYRIEKTHRLPLRLGYPLTTKRTDFTLKKDEQWSVDVELDTLIAGSLEGQLTLSATPPLALNGYFDYLLSYPYGCLEQTTSRALPWLSINEPLVAEYNLNDQIQKRMEAPYSPALRLEALTQAIDGIKQKQRADGSFSLWSGAAREYPWLTVYATEILVDAAKAGIPVPKGVVDKSIRILRKYLRRGASVQVVGWVDNRQYHVWSVQAYAGYVLAKANRANLSDLRRFSGELQQNPVGGSLPWMHLAASFKLVGADSDSRDAVAKAQSFARPQGYLGDYGSEVRDLALSYTLSLKHELDLELDFIELRRAIQERRWLSTQDRARLFALASLLVTDDSSFSAELSLKGREAQRIDDKSRFNALLSAEQLTALTQITSLSERLYGSLTHISASSQAPARKSDIIDIDKTYFDLEGFPTGLEAVKAGQLLIVELSLTASKNIRDALVVDLLPAGFVLENQNLSDASVDISSLQVDGAPIKQATNLAHQEFREDRYVAAMALQQDRQVKLYYLVRATVPGQFQVPPTYVEDMFEPADHGLGDASRLVIHE